MKRSISLDIRVLQIVTAAVSTDKSPLVELDAELINSLGLDSVSLLLILFELEKEFNLKLSGSSNVDFGKIRTVKDIVDALAVLMPA